MICDMDPWLSDKSLLHPNFFPLINMSVPFLILLKNDLVIIFKLFCSSLALKCKQLESVGKEGIVSAFWFYLLWGQWKNTLIYELYMYLYQCLRLIKTHWSFQNSSEYSISSYLNFVCSYTKRLVRLTLFTFSMIRKNVILLQ